MTNEALQNEGLNIVKRFCELNDIPMPTIVFSNAKRGCCGYYVWHSGVCTIMPASCARPTLNPVRSWSYPHYFVDRTILGVICHEFGHYVHEYLKFPRLGKLGLQITKYEPNMHERFAETMKLFLTNPNLLKAYNRERYDFLTVKLKLKPVYTTDWLTQLSLYGTVNDKYINACNNRIRQAIKTATKIPAHLKRNNMIQRFSTLTMESMVVCKIDETAQPMYDSLGIKPWHHIIIVNDYAFIYLWDTRIIEHVMPASCLRQEDLTYAVIDNRMDLVVNDETSKTIREICEANKFDIPVLFCSEPMTDDEKALLDPMHY